MSDRGSAKWWILGGVVALGAVIAGLTLGGEDPPTAPRADGPPGEASVTVRGGGGGELDEASGGADLGTRARAPRFGGDGGVAPAPSPTRRADAIRTPSGVEGAVLRRQNVPDEADRTSGWQLGRTRRRVALLEERVERLEEIVERLRGEGRSDLADRQASVIARTRTRLGELREQAQELTAQASADGTIGDAEAGFEAELPGMGRPAAAGALPPRE